MAFKLHKEARKVMPISLLVIAILIAIGYAVLPLLGHILLIAGLALAMIIVNFFRNPEVTVQTDPNAILAPCDGRVVVIEEVVDHKYLNGPVRQISIFMSPLNVHVNRNPISGTIKQITYYPGKYLMAFNPKSSTDNEQTYIVAQNDRLTVAWKQIAGFLARRLCWYIKEGDPVVQGAEFGFIRFGSRIDVLFPLECEVKVNLQEGVKAGKTVLAVLPGDEENP